MSVRKGTYVLFLTFSEPFEGDVGRLGRIYLEPGTYCYVGSAMGGLDQRISRHLSKGKRLRWHIDRLTEAADAIEAYESYPSPVPECVLAYTALSTGCAEAVHGFGCSDCGCGSHLFRVPLGAEPRLVSAAGLERWSGQQCHTSKNDPNSY